MKFRILGLALSAAFSLSATTVITNGSFETPALTPGTFQYNPSGATWTFTGQSGISTNGSAWGFAPAPSGTQEAFLQVFQQTSSSFSETVTNVVAGDTINFFEAQRSGFLANSFNVLYNGTVLGSFTPGSTAWTQVSVVIPNGALASGTLMFQSTGALGSDLDAGIDNITVTAASPTPEPATGLLMLGFGAVMVLVRKTRRA